LRQLFLTTIFLATALAQAAPQTSPASSPPSAGDTARAEADIAELQQQQRKLLEQVRRELAAIPASAPGGSATAERRRQLEALLAEIERRINEEAGSKTRYLSPGTKDPDFQAYYQRFAKEVIARGNTHLSNASSKPAHGQVVVSVTLRNSGHVESVEIFRTTSPELAKRVSEMLKAIQPFESFPPVVARNANRLVLVIGLDYAREQ
jgi:protein TonB